MNEKKTLILIQFFIFFFKIPVNGQLNVTTEGSGVARMEVEFRYNVNVSEHDDCKFHIEVFDSPVELAALLEYGYSPQE